VKDGYYGDITIDVSCSPYESGFKFNTLPFGGMTIDTGNAVRIGSASDIKLVPASGTVSIGSKIASSSDLKITPPADKVVILETTGSIPAATSALRGALYFVRSANGTADALKVCIKNAADAYEWKTVTLA
jgi:hypothetical protein